MSRRGDGGEPEGQDDEDDEDDEDGEEAAAFREAVRGATPIDPRERQRRAPAPAGQPPGGAPSAGPAAAASSAFIIAETGETIAARGAGVDARQLRRLRAGEHPVEARLDLHGSAGAETAPALERFIATAQSAGRRCVLVIHGRGNRSPAGAPVIRPAVWEWLIGSRRARASVMAFASAPSRLGGAGATLILLRKARAPG